MAASFTLISFILPWSLLAPSISPAPGFAPKEPINTFIRLRFIARHIKMVSTVPAAPTRIPPVSIALLLYKNPALAAATPVKEFSREITTGISAPPIGRTKKTPYNMDRINVA